MAGKLKICAVDDDPDILLMLEGLLEECSDYMGTKYPEEVIEYFLAHKDFDVLLVDMMMPNARTALQLIKDLRSCGFLGCILVLTATPESIVVERLLYGGANGVIGKRSTICADEILAKAKNFNQKVYPPEQIS